MARVEIKGRTVSPEAERTVYRVKTICATKSDIPAMGATLTGDYPLLTHSIGPFMVAASTNSTAYPGRILVNEVYVAPRAITGEDT